MKVAQWERHKPRVFRLYLSRVCVTVAPSYERREWIWVADRRNRLGCSELARGRMPTQADAKKVGAIVARELDAIERRLNESRMTRGVPKRQRGTTRDPAESKLASQSHKRTDRTHGTSGANTRNAAK